MFLTQVLKVKMLCQWHTVSYAVIVQIMSNEIRFLRRKVKLKCFKPLQIIRTFQIISSERGLRDLPSKIVDG